MQCPCHSQESYEECCKRYHEGEAAPTPEKLMRSRYSAYALGFVDYVLRTQANRVPAEQIRAFCETTEFRDLKILKVEPFHVTFHATLFQKGQDVSFTERSLFERRENDWIYIGKTALP